MLFTKLKEKIKFSAVNPKVAMAISAFAVVVSTVATVSNLLYKNAEAEAESELQIKLLHQGQVEVANQLGKCEIALAAERANRSDMDAVCAEAVDRLESLKNALK